MRVTVDADWGGDPVRAQNVSFSVIVEADASEAAILDLIRHTDNVAEIPQLASLAGTKVSMAEAKAVSDLAKLVAE